MQTTASSRQALPPPRSPPVYTTAFRELLRSAGVTPIRLPPSSPNLNAYAERFVRSIKSECLSKLVLVGENHLRTAVREYVAYNHTERDHQGLEGRLIELPASAAAAGPIRCRERIGGAPALPPPAGGLNTSRLAPDRSSAADAWADSCACASIIVRRPETTRSNFFTLRDPSYAESALADSCASIIVRRPETPRASFRTFAGSGAEDAPKSRRGHLCA